MELLVQKYLRSGKTLEELFSEHGVKSYISNGKIGLNYSQLDASNSDQLACECRGLILSENNFDIIACPFFRFFNMEQTDVAAKIDWNSARYQEKIDGSCVIVAFDPITHKWFCATRGRPEADGTINDSDIKFSDLVNIAADYMLRKNSTFNGDKRSTLNEMMEYVVHINNDDVYDYTFIFELTSPFNRIVCYYDETSLTLLGTRNNKTLKEVNPKLFDFGIYGIKTPKEYLFSSIENMVEVIRSWNPKEHEGIVVVDNDFNRIKVKNPAYLSFNYLRDSLATSLRGCIEVILLEKDDDVIPMMPQIIAERITALKPLVKEVLSQTEKDYNELKNIAEMKEYALKAQEKLWPAALFALKRNKTSDLKTYSLGNVTDKTKIPSGASEKMLELCHKLYPEKISAIKNLVFDIEA